MNLDAELAFDHAWERIEDLHHRQILTDHDLDAGPLGTPVRQTGGPLVVEEAAEVVHHADTAVSYDDESPRSDPASRKARKEWWEDERHLLGHRRARVACTGHGAQR